MEFADTRIEYDSRPDFIVLTPIGADSEYGHPIYVEGDGTRYELKFGSVLETMFDRTS
jgi:hypothetical protein